MVEVEIQFCNLSAEQLEHLLKAEDELEKVGLQFDRNHGPLWKRRVWKLNQSLKGAKAFLINESQGEIVCLMQF